MAWDFIGKWWNLGNNFWQQRLFSLDFLFNLQGKGIISSIWCTIVAATCWSLWLSRNDRVFRNVNTDKSTLEFLIFNRVSQWGEASGLIPFSKESLWKVNPQGVIQSYYFKVSRDFWVLKRQNADFTGITDGAWGLNENGCFVGGIGGKIMDKNGQQIYVFSGSVQTQNTTQAEIAAIVHVLELCSSDLRFKGHIITLFSDSLEAINSVKSGYSRGFPILINGKSSDLFFGNGLDIQYAPRHLIEEVDSLAKSGLNRLDLTTYWA